MHDGESKDDKYNRGLDLFIESVLKPDSKRQCAHNQKCYHELMKSVRQFTLSALACP